MKILYCDSKLNKNNLKPGDSDKISPGKSDLNFTLKTVQ